MILAWMGWDVVRGTWLANCWRVGGLRKMGWGWTKGTVWYWGWG